MKQLDGQLSIFDDPDRVEKMDRLHEIYREALGILHVPLKNNPEKCREEIRKIAAEKGCDMEQMAEALREYFGTCGFTVKGAIFEMEYSNCWIQAKRPWETMIIPWKTLARDIRRMYLAGTW